jgi:hypothetical protein
VTWPKVPTRPIFEEADEEEEVVPETEDSYQVIVFEIQAEVDEVVVDNNKKPRDVVTGSTYGGGRPPTESEGDDYSPYSQFSEQGHTFSHCGNEVATYRFPTCTYGYDVTCADCNEEWLGNEDDCPVGAHGFHNWKRKLIDTEGCYPGLKVVRRF